MALTAKQKLFVKEYLVDLNATQAAIRAKYSAKTAEQQASRLLSNVKVQEAIQKAMNKRAEKVEISAEQVLQRWIDIAFADPNEIIHFRRVCCRYCFGIEHQYQWIDETEYEAAVKIAKDEAEAGKGKKKKAVQLPSDRGGYGFDPLIRPHPKCPNCHGEGHGQLHINDTRELSPKAKALYAGAKSTAAGLEIKMHDQDKALDNIARHLGMFKDESKIDLTIRNKLEDFFK
ncbi:terminase small subunit [Paenibacillus bouchesdurhonensis]|uniref:terminase small subunit n=1 Tax=Paenibacillus bouchesdurhonensis TaxID=1870990 RepID=UPI000DA5EE21|nr:terminase small subunit [Paenibacillus bouchesdurhonensis]